MIIKVNRVATHEEFQKLQELNVDIIGFSIDRIKKLERQKNHNNRAVSVEEVVNILKQNSRKSKISIHIYYYSDLDSVMESVIKEIKPDYINYHLDFRTHWTEYEIKSFKIYESKNIPSIIFGNGFGYDTDFLFDVNDIKIVKNLKFLEMSSETISTTSRFAIESGKYWKIKQSETSDLLLETVQRYFEKIPVLIDDTFNPTTISHDLERVKAKGITLSLKNSEKGIFNKNEDFYFLSEITENYYSFENTIQLINNIKNY